MQADKLLYNGNVYTMHANAPRAQAVAIAGDRILAVGDSLQLRDLLGPRGKSVDLHGQTVLPGFTDSHIHFLSYGLSLQEIDLMEIAPFSAAQERIAKRAATTPAGEWLVGRGWDQSLWDINRFPQRQDLDAITGDHPTYLRRKCGHIGWANSAALQLANITSQTTDPDGGEIERDRTNGEPTGILKERAMGLVERLLAQPSAEAATQGMRASIARAHQHGIVSVHNMEDATALQAAQALRDQGELTIRIVQQIPENDLDAAIKIGLRSGWGDHWLRIGAVKIFSDGALGARTALMRAPYEGDSDNRGIAVASADHLHIQVAKAARAGIAVHIHAIGDLANHNVLNAIESAQLAGLGPKLRHRIEHAQLLLPEDIPRFARLGIVASMQPIHATQDMFLADRHWGTRSTYAYAFRSLLDSGACLAFGSDAPVEDLNVLRGIHAAVTRRRADGSPGPQGWYPEQRLTMQQAVHGYTVGAAYSVGQESVTGQIAPGMLADLVVLSDDIFAIDPAALLETDIIATYVGGQIVFSR